MHGTHTNTRIFISFCCFVVVVAFLSATSAAAAASSSSVSLLFYFIFFFRYWEAISNRAQSFSSKLEDCLRLRMAIHRTPSKTADTVFSLLAAAAATSAEAIFYRLALLPAVNRFSQFTQNVSRIQIGLLDAFLTPRTL